MEDGSELGNSQIHKIEHKPIGLSLKFEKAIYIRRL